MNYLKLNNLFLYGNLFYYIIYGNQIYEVDKVDDIFNFAMKNKITYYKGTPGFIVKILNLSLNVFNIKNTFQEL